MNLKKIDRPGMYCIDFFIFKFTSVMHVIGIPFKVAQSWPSWQCQETVRLFKHVYLSGG